MQRNSSVESAESLGIEHLALVKREEPSFKAALRLCIFSKDESGSTGAEQKTHREAEDASCTTTLGQ